jgi:hypothetical protein
VYKKRNRSVRKGNNVAIVKKDIHLRYMVRYIFIIFLVRLVVGLGSYVLMLDRKDLHGCPWIERAIDEGCGDVDWFFKPWGDLFLDLGDRQISAIGSPGSAFGTGYAVNHLILIS